MIVTGNYHKYSYSHWNYSTNNIALNESFTPKKSIKNISDVPGVGCGPK